MRNKSALTDIIERVTLWGNLVKFSHSVFALPFAFAMGVLLQKDYPISLPDIGQMLVCVVAARFAAMAFNRLVDHRLDAENPRTRMREIPRGAVHLVEAGLLILLSSFVFIYAASLLSRLCGLMSVPVLIVLFGYSYCKRVTALSHLVLGISLAFAPAGVWLAVTGEFSWQPVPLMLAVMLWVAGFDVVYALQDIEFDQSRGLRSIPALLGSNWARICAALFHVGTIICLSITGILFDVGVWFWSGIIAFAILITTQHVSICLDSKAHIERIFFVRNGFASVVFLFFTAIDALVG
jgi:4-hydroxybenzoate polyprenyltransferase